MKFFIVVAFILPIAFCEECPEFPAVECAEGEIECPGYEWDGCEYPGYCNPLEWENWEGVMCPSVCSTYCAEDEMWCDNGEDDNGCWAGNWCMPNPDGDAMCPTPPTQCPDIEPIECGEGEIQCWGGMDCEGCPMMDYCTMAEWDMGDGVMCPGQCEPMCMQNDTWCDNGYDANGCWMGAWCMYNPDGTEECPPPAVQCAELETVECSEGEMSCWGGEDENHCPYADYCISSTYELEDGTECWNTCEMPCGATDLWCDNGYDHNGCWMGSHCLPTENTWDDCPVFCPTNCDWTTEMWCDSGMDENGCWMGNYCMPNADGTAECEPTY